MTNLQSLRNLATAINQPFAKHREMEICRLGMQCNPPMPSLDLARAYNGSLDGAMSLHNALLPGATWLVRATDKADVTCNNRSTTCGGFANIWGGTCLRKGDADLSVYAETPARAWLLSIVLALIHIEETEK